MGFRTTAVRGPAASPSSFAADLPRCCLGCRLQRRGCRLRGTLRRQLSERPKTTHRSRRKWAAWINIQPKPGHFVFVTIFNQITPNNELAESLRPALDSLRKSVLSPALIEHFNRIRFTSGLNFDHLMPKINFPKISGPITNIAPATFDLPKFTNLHIELTQTLL